MIYIAFQPILALHIMNFSSCQNYWGGGANTICLPPPPHISTYPYFCRVHLGVLPPPQYQKAGYAEMVVVIVVVVVVVPSSSSSQ